jgi:uroporphyrin-3 C-methyltransferase
MTAKETETEGATAPAPRRSFAGLLAVFALVVAVAAAGIGAWSSIRLSSLENLPARVSGDEDQLLELSRRVDLLSEDSLDYREDLLQLQTRLEVGLRALEGLPETVDQLEQTVAALPGINQPGRSQWLKTEATYYLRIANAQVLLGGDAEVIAGALRLADEKLRETGDPTVTPVRAALSKEIAALEAMPQIDRAGVSFRLQALSTMADSWPLRAVAPDSFTPASALVDPELGYWDRFVATLKKAFSSIISVKETDTPPLAQLGGAEQALIVESVKAELQVARLAFATGNQELFSGSLARTRAQIELYFDTGSAAVASALATVDEIQAMEMPGALPDVSRSLALMLGEVKPTPEVPAEIAPPDTVE